MVIRFPSIVYKLHIASDPAFDGNGKILGCKTVTTIAHEQLYKLFSFMHPPDHP